jgi:hypothetical protein
MPTMATIGTLTGLALWKNGDDVDGFDPVAGHARKMIKPCRLVYTIVGCLFAGQDLRPDVIDLRSQILRPDLLDPRAGRHRLTIFLILSG